MTIVSAFVAAAEGVVSQEFKNEKQALATREDIKKAVKESIHSPGLKIQQSNGDIHKVMFWASIGQLLAIAGWCFSES